MEEWIGRRGGVSWVNASARIFSPKLANTSAIVTADKQKSKGKRENDKAKREKEVN